MITLLKIILFIPLLIKNIIDRKKDPNPVEPCDRFGLCGFLGLAGEGKTMSMTYELNRLRKKYNNDIIIATNFFYKYQDFEFNNINQLYKTYDKTIVFAWDELPDYFNNRDFAKFPYELINKMTQLRKGNGMRILFTAQEFGLVDITFRRLTAELCQCRTYKNYFTYYKKYKKNEYEHYMNSKSTDVKDKIIPIETKFFIQNDYLRNSYDSFQILNNAREMTQQNKYLSREERSKIQNLL